MKEQYKVEGSIKLRKKTYNFKPSNKLNEIIQRTHNEGLSLNICITFR